MKKLFALVLALTMVLSLASCGGGDKPAPAPSEPTTPPSSSQQTDPGTDQPEETSNVGGQQAGNSKTYEWPTADFSSDDVKWTGTGNIVYIDDEMLTFTKTGEEVQKRQVYVDAATLEEVAAYIDALKASGISYYDTTLANDSTFEFDSFGSYLWTGLAADESYVKVSLHKEAQTGFDGAYQPFSYSLEIAMLEKSPVIEGG